MAANQNNSFDRLPTHVVPRHYGLALEPDFTKLTFDGQVIIDAEVNDDTTSITVNTLELKIHSAEVRVLEHEKGLTLRSVAFQLINYMQCY